MMEYYPVGIERLDREKWDALVEGTGTVFQLSLWLELWQRTFPFKAGVYAAYEQRELMGGIPFCRREKFGMREAYSMPRGCYGGALIRGGADPELRSELETEFTFWCMRENFSRINVIELSQVVNTNWEAYEVRPLSTHLLNLKYADDEQVQKLADSHRRNVDKAVDQEFELAEIKTRPEVGEYFELQIQTAARQGRQPFYRLEFYETLLTLFKDSGKLYWPKVLVDGRTAAAAIVFFHGTGAVYWDGATSPAARETGANFFLFWSLIQLCRKRGLEILNLGSGPQKAVGLKRFKSSWGADRIGYFEYDYQRPVSRFIRKAKGML